MKSLREWFDFIVVMYRCASILSHLNIVLDDDDDLYECLGASAVHDPEGLKRMHGHAKRDNLPVGQLTAWAERGMYIAQRVHDHVEGKRPYPKTERDTDLRRMKSLTFFQ